VDKRALREKLESEKKKKQNPNYEGNCFNEWKKLLYKKRSLELVNAAVTQCKAEENEKKEKHVEQMRMEHMSKGEMIRSEYH
jgi:hypothetical protein